MRDCGWEKHCVYFKRGGLMHLVNGKEIKVTNDLITAAHSIE